MATVTFNSAYASRGNRSKRKLARGGLPLRPESDSRLTRQHQHPWETRKELSEDYDRPVTDREGWWRTYIRETPTPGTYQFPTFIEEMSVKPNTYRFRSDGRKMDAHPHGKGALLMPGAYEFPHFLENLVKTPTPATYSFKGCSRDSLEAVTMGTKDRNINVCPTAYKVEKYLSLSADKSPSTHMMFRSQAKRFPTIYFKPKEGPAPGNYDYLPPGSQHPVSSSFKSRTPRFFTSHTKVPGPGTYEKTFQFPIPSTVAKMGRQHGLFFSSAFQT